ncbi:MAG TPA: polysaccharide deacetylase family protein [Nannocystaceae bacterium]|nr:polysaccharide deacetylase family protein [Nannocystaceae bacterium]
MGLKSVGVAWVATLLPVLGMLASWEQASARVMRRTMGVLATPRFAVADAAPAHVDDTTLASALPPIEVPEAPPGVYFSGPTDTAMVALTFDDGPSPTLTPRILEILREHDARATFFVLGQQAERHTDALRVLVESGQEIGNHAFSHTSFRSLFPTQIAEELDRTARAIANAGGSKPRLVRPPYGRFPDSTIALAASRGEDLVLWTVDGGDSEHADTDTIVARVLRGARPGSVILLHDRDLDTLHALPAILAGLARKGLKVVSVSELLGQSNASLSAAHSDLGKSETPT